MKSFNFALALYDANWPILHLFSFISAWIASVRATYRLRIAPNFGGKIALWLAHALNGRRVAGASCAGELGKPAVTALAG